MWSPRSTKSLLFWRWCASRWLEGAVESQCSLLLPGVSEDYSLLFPNIENIQLKSFFKRLYVWTSHSPMFLQCANWVNVLHTHTHTLYLYMLCVLIRRVFWTWSVHLKPLIYAAVGQKIKSVSGDHSENKTSPNGMKSHYTCLCMCVGGVSMQRDKRRFEGLCVITFYDKCIGKVVGQ